MNVVPSPLGGFIGTSPDAPIKSALDALKEVKDARVLSGVNAQRLNSCIEHLTATSELITAILEDHNVNLDGRAPADEPKRAKSSRFILGGN